MWDEMELSPHTGSSATHFVLFVVLLSPLACQPSYFLKWIKSSTRRVIEPCSETPQVTCHSFGRGLQRVSGISFPPHPMATLFQWPVTNAKKRRKTLVKFHRIPIYPKSIISNCGNSSECLQWLNPEVVYEIIKTVGKIRPSPLLPK